MKIAAIIDRKGSHFETVQESVPLIEAIAIMDRLSIGSVGIRRDDADKDDADKIVGIISQQELMAGISLRGPHALQLPVITFARRAVMFCRCADDAADVMRKMTNERSRHAVVKTEAGVVAGILSLGDLVAALLADAQLEAGVLRDMARSHMLSLPA